MSTDFLDLLAFEQGYETVDDLLDSRPYVSKPEKHLLLVLKCSQCSHEDSNDYTRQNPDKLRLRRWCPDCHADLVLVNAIPNTILYWSHSFKHATFCDEVTKECWHCGRKKGPLHSYTFSNGQQVELCRKDFVRYHKDVWRLEKQRAQFLANYGSWEAIDLPDFDDLYPLP